MAFRWWQQCEGIRRRWCYRSSAALRCIDSDWSCILLRIAGLLVFYARLASFGFWRLSSRMILLGEKKRSHRFDARPDIALSNTPCGLGRDKSSLLSALRKSRGRRQGTSSHQRPSRNAPRVGAADFNSALPSVKPHLIARSAASKTRVLVTKLSVPTA